MHEKKFEIIKIFIINYANFIILYNNSEAKI